MSVATDRGVGPGWALFVLILLLARIFPSWKSFGACVLILIPMPWMACLGRPAADGG